MEQGGAFDPAHQIDNRNPHAERAENPLKHNEYRSAAAVEIAYKTEQNRGQQTVDGIGFQIIVSICDDLIFSGKDRGQQIPRKNAAVPMMKPAIRAVSTP